MVEIGHVEEALDTKTELKAIVTLYRKTGQPAKTIHTDQESGQS